MFLNWMEIRTRREVYAWTCPLDGQDRAMLRSERIAGPAEAVRATLQASGWGPNFNALSVDLAFGSADETSRP